jgi:hypothetical protein
MDPKISSSWFTSEVVPAIYASALALDYWAMMDSYRATNSSAGGSTALVPGPNNALRGLNGRFVTNPNSARSQAAASPTGSVHGNSLSYPGPTTLYGLYERSSNTFLKWGSPTILRLGTLKPSWPIAALSQSRQGRGIKWLLWSGC